MNKRIVNDEIDLLEFILILWKYKYKILLITTLFVVVMFGYQTTQPQNKDVSTKGTATTNIIPISSLNEAKFMGYNFYLNKTILAEKSINKELDINASKNNNSNDYKASNNFILKKIDKNYLLKLFTDQIKKHDFVKSVIKNSYLLKKENYQNIQKYEEAVNQLANSINIIAPVYDEEKGTFSSSNWVIKFQTDNLNEWKDFLKKLNLSINQEIKKFILDSFEVYKINKKKMIEYSKEDIENEIANALEANNQKFLNRLAFLSEQAAIARELNMAETNSGTNKLESQVISTESGIITKNIKTETPYFMRGYEMIEKEIELIKNRKNQDAFNEKLIQLNTKMRQLLQDNDIERIQSLLEETPLIKSNEFFAAKIMYERSTFKVKSNSKSRFAKMNFLSGIIGVLFAIFYVMVSVAIQKRKISKYK